MKNLIQLFLLLGLSANLAAQEFPLDDMKKSLPCVDKVFNVRVIMTVDSMYRSPHLSAEQVDSIFTDLNRIFEPICMRFKTCDYVISPNYSQSNLRNQQRLTEMGRLFQQPRRLNVFFVQDVYGAACGSSLFEGFDKHNQAKIFVELHCEDAVMQLAHHMGQLLGLNTTNFEGSQELVDGSNCAIAGDRICDTPADPLGFVRDTSGVWQMLPDPSWRRYARNCEFVWEGLDDNGDYYSPKTGNIMSLYPCKCQFTPEQYFRMAEYYLSASIKLY